MAHLELVALKNPNNAGVVTTSITPEGYDVSDIHGAELYLTEIHGKILPKARGSSDARTGSHLARSLQEARP